VLVFSQKPVFKGRSLALPGLGTIVGRTECIPTLFVLTLGWWNVGPRCSSRDCVSGF
jgi:hypothetical protein